MDHVKRQRKELQTLIVSALCIAVVAYAAIVGLVLAVPHLPLANKRTFYALLRAQLAVDNSAQLATAQKQMVLFLGSSVVERGVSERYMDTVFQSHGVRYQTTNAGTGGFCAEANLPMFRAMLDQGLHPSVVVYGVCLQELNRTSSVHAGLGTDDTSAVKLKPRTLWNLIRYGPAALQPLLYADHLHQYVFAANNAFRDVPNPTLFDRLMFGVNAFARDSLYTFEPRYVEDLREIVRLCKSRHIAFAFYNAPLKPRIESQAEVPFQHREESYRAIMALGRDLDVPLWNFDHKGLFNPEEFQDSYHLTPIGARKISAMLATKILDWQTKGSVVRDGLETLE